MSSAQSNESVNRRKFTDLLFRRLRYRWLDDREIVNDAIEDLFMRRHAARKRFVDQLVAAQNVRRLSEPAHLRQWLAGNTVVRSLFRHRDGISLPSVLVHSILSSGGYRWPVPPIANAAVLSRFLRLGSPSVLDWLTIPHHRRDTSIDHYRRRKIRKRDGTVRWIEQPAPTLKHVQHVIAQELLCQIPLHDAAMGFRRRISIGDCARHHVGRRTVMRMDLQNFFGSIHIGRVRALFAFAGYPTCVVNALSQLCTAPAIDPFDSPLGRSRLPQGAPTSPGLANAIAFGLDRRLAAFAKSMQVTYTRYADDLFFSSDDHSISNVKRMATTIAVIVMEEGYDMNFRKTQIMRHGMRQRVLGLTVNHKLNTSRKDYETLKAILHNCQRNGPESQNRARHPEFQASLRGRIAQIATINPARGERLLSSFRQIDWSTM